MTPDRNVVDTTCNDAPGCSYEDELFEKAVIIIKSLSDEKLREIMERLKWQI